MSIRYYGLLLGFAATLSFALAGCGGTRRDTAADPVAGAAVKPQAVKRTANELDTQGTLWTWLGFAKRPPDNPTGPVTGMTVSPVLWEAAKDTLKFAGIGSEDPTTGLLVTNWYSPPSKPDERIRVSVFILSRALRSDSLALTIEREVRSAGGGWEKSSVAQDTVAELDNAILLRARHIHAERYRNTMFN